MNIVKNVKFFLSIARMKITGQMIPLTVIFNVTNRCNARCKHCYASYFSRDTSGEMKTEDAKRLIADLNKNGCQRISFSGGEPLLRNDIGDLIRHANRLNMGTALNTNGLLVPRHIALLQQLDALAISLDGHPENHDYFRGAGTGRDAIKAIKKAREAGVRVHINMVLNKRNLHDIDYILGLATTHHCKVEFNVAISNIFGEGLASGEFKPSNREIKDALSYIIRRKKEGAPVLFSKEAYESVLFCWADFAKEGTINTPPPKGMPLCPAGKIFCLIDADGTLWACPHLIGRITAKNALNVGVAEAWRTATRHPCTGCYQVYHHEFSYLMNLKPQVVWNYIKTSIGLS